ncbi:MAG: hypothetical protein WC011_01170 [Candidatus Paceibacterota bacterium]
MEYKSEKKTCQNCQNDFTIESDDFSFYEKVKVPPPTFCPECRFQRRASWRNDFSLYNRKCDSCDMNVVSMYSPESNIIIYCNKCWWSDKWDGIESGKDYNFSENFFSQLNKLIYKIPHIALVNDNNIASIKCEYTGDTWFSKNCYMTFCSWHIENVSYGYMVLAGKNMTDCTCILESSEWMYDCLDCSHSYKLKSSYFCVSCIDSDFLYDCRNCSDCFMCIGLRGEKYCFKNKKYTKEEYEKILSTYELNTYEGRQRAKKEFKEFILKYPRKYAHIIQSLNVTGDLLSNSKNSQNCFIGDKIENCKYIQQGGKNLDCYDITTSGEHELGYEGIVLDHSSNNKFGLFSVKSQFLEYNMHCHNCKYVFGCVGLKNKSYCIFNKQYKKEEYFEMVEKIKNHMNEMPYVDKKGNVYRYGEFFPIELSYFGYNETIANYFFPLNEKEILDKNYKFQYNIQKTTGKQTIESTGVPISLENVDESFIDNVFECIDCKRNFKVISDEFKFYKIMNLPLPRSCFYCRLNERLFFRNPFKLWHRSCMKEGCNNEFETSYAPERPEIVYCEKCYQSEVY